MSAVIELASRVYPQRFACFMDFLNTATSMANELIDRFGEGAVDDIIKQFPDGDFYTIEIELVKQHIELSRIALKEVNGDLPNMFRKELLKIART